MKILYTILVLTICTYATDLTQKITKLTQINANQATIQIGNLAIGQSGIIINENNSKKAVIICFATVINSNEKESTLKFNFKEIIQQDAIPKTNRQPKVGDKFILNHLYQNSMIIAPNFKTNDDIKKLYGEWNFLDSDLFAAYLKINNTPAPKKKDILEFAHKNELGTILFAFDNKLFIVDTVSFLPIKNIDFTIDDNTTHSPFYTNVDEIKTGTFSFFEEESIGDYNKYYKKLLGIEDGK